MLTSFSHFNHLGLLPLSLSNPNTPQGSDQFPKQGWPVLANGSRSHVSLHRILAVHCLH